MDPQITVGILALVAAVTAALITQTFLQRRWVREQGDKREERMTAQTNAMVDNAVQLAEANRHDAEQARVLALEASRAHSECSQQVAALSGQMTELRIRLEENERTQSIAAHLAEQHQGIKHMAVTALTVSESITGLVVKQATRALEMAKDAELVPDEEARKVLTSAVAMLEPISDLIDGYHPRLQEVVDENNRVFHPDAIDVKETP